MSDIIVEVAILKMDHTWSTEDIKLTVRSWCPYEEVCDMAEAAIRADMNFKKIAVAHITTISVRVSEDSDSFL